MKRIIYIFITLIITLSFVLPVVAYASEHTEEGEIPSSVEEVPEQNPENTEDINIFTRLYEAFVGNRTEVFSLLGSGVLLVLSIILKKDLGAVSNRIIDNIAKVLSKSDVSEKKQSAIIDGLNEMVDGYNEIREKTELMQIDLQKVGERITSDISELCKEFKSDVGDFYDQIKDVARVNSELDVKVEKLFNVVISLIDKEITQNAEVMDVLTSVYENNDALPQGIKNYVALKHAENTKVVAEASTILHSIEEGVSNE